MARSLLVLFGILSLSSGALLAQLPAPSGLSCRGATSLSQVVQYEFVDPKNWAGDLNFGPGSWSLPSNTGSSTNATGPSQAHSGRSPHEYAMYEGLRSNGNAAELISSAIDLRANYAAAELSFFVHAHGQNIGQFEVSLSTSPTGPWTNVASSNGPIQTDPSDAWQAVGVNLSAYLGQQCYVRFFHKPNGSGQDRLANLALDLLEVYACQQVCLPPSNIAVGNLTNTTATVSFNNGNANATTTVSVCPQGNPFGHPSCVTQVGQSPVVFTGLGAGQAYDSYLRADCSFGPSALVGGPAFVPGPANNTCAGALPVLASAAGTCPSGTGAQTGDFPNASLVGPPISCSPLAASDLWYTWTATSPSFTFINGTTPLKVVVYEGSCGALTEVDCQQAGVSKQVRGLTVGQTYFLRVFTEGTALTPFSWCLAEGPACGDPAWGPATNIGHDRADLTVLPSSPGTHTIEYGPAGFTPGTGTGTQLALGTQTQVTITGLLGATAYHVYFQADCRGSFVQVPLVFTTAPTPPVNNDCGNALSVPLGSGTCGTTVTSTDVNATASSGTGCGVGSNLQRDTWLAFTATGPTAFFELLNAPTLNNTRLVVYEGCGGSCVLPEQSVQRGSTLRLTNLTAGTRYVLRLNSYQVSGGTYAVCIRDAGPPPANNQCADATPIAVGTQTCGPTIATDLSAATASTGVICDANNADVWFSFTANSDRASFTTVSLPSAASPAELYVMLYETCGAACLTGSQAALVNQPVDFNNLTPNTTYLLRLFELGNDDLGIFQFCMESPLPPPSNDLCADAIPVTLGVASCGPLVSASNISATGMPGTACGTPDPFFGGADVWFSFVAGGTTALLDLHTTPGQLYASVYDGCGGGCVYDNSALSTTVDERIPGLTPGATYYLRLYDIGADDFGTIEFCMYTPPPPPPNDECSGALPVTVGTGTCGPSVAATNVGATGTAGSACGSSSLSFGNEDVWYSFVAGATSVFLSLENDLGPTASGSLYFSVYDACGGSCVWPNDELTEFTDTEVLGLTAGTTYYLRVYDQFADDQGSFDFCMYSPGIPPANDFCSGALPVAVGQNSCGPSVSTDNTYATGQAGSACGTSSGFFGEADTWFSFVAPTHDVELELGTGQGRLYASLYSDCSGTCVVNNQEIDRFDNAVFSGLTAGATYYLQVYELGANQLGTLSFCLLEQVPLPSVAESVGCTAPITATVDGSGTPSAIHFFAPSGGIVASIANTQALGLVTVQLFDQTGVRALGSTGRFDLGRNISIVPAQQPTAPLDVWVYVTNAEIQDYVAVDPGVTALEFLKVPTSSCSMSYPGGGSALTVGTNTISASNGLGLPAMVSSFSEFFITGLSVPLPVELASLSAKPVDATNEITWVAASEVDVRAYHLERSTDGFRQNRSEVNTVPAKGTAAAAAVYSILDAEPAPTSYYRLRMEDLDGSVVYSDIVSLSRHHLAKSPSFRLVPNPVSSGIVQVEFADPHGQSLRNVVVTDAGGRLVHTQVFDARFGTLEVSALPAGVYAVSVLSATGTNTRRLVVE